MAIYENHILQLHPNTIANAVRPILLALLPGLEDASSDEYEIVLALITQLRRKTAQLEDSEDDRLFWQAFFLASIRCPDKRSGVLAYVDRELPSFATGNIAQAIAADSGLLIRCFVSGLQDDQLLIQRGFLEILVKRLPLACELLQSKIPQSDLVLLVQAAAGVTTRREMSLNRRLWAWFIGPVHPGETVLPSRSVTGHFQEYGLEPLVSALSILLSDTNPVAARRSMPFRVCASLMDREEIGDLVLPKILVKAMENIERFQTEAKSAGDYDEVHRSAIGFFDAVDSRQLWLSISVICVRAFRWRQNGENAQMLLRLIHHFLIQFNVQRHAKASSHFSFLLLVLVQGIAELSCSGSPNALLDDAFAVLFALLDHLSLDQAAQSLDLKDLETQIEQMNISYPQDETLMQSLINKLLPVVTSHLSCAVNGSCISALLKLIEKAPDPRKIDLQPVFPPFQVLLQQDQDLDWTTVAELCRLYRTLQETFSSSKEWQSSRSMGDATRLLISRLWNFISSAIPTHSVEAMQWIPVIYENAPQRHLVEERLANLFLCQGAGPTTDSLRKLSTLITFHIGVEPRKQQNDFSLACLTKPILLLIEGTRKPRNWSDDCVSFVRKWLCNLADTYP